MDEPPLPSPPRQPPQMPPPFVPPQVRDRPPPLPPIPGRPTSLWQETLEEHRNSPTSDDASFGGWLILIGIGRVLAIPISLFSLFHLCRTYFTPGLWTRLTSPDSPAYHPLWATAIIYELAGRAVLLGWCIALAWLFFARKRALRPWFIAYGVLLLIFQWGDHFLALPLLASRGTPTTGDLPRLIGTTVGTLIWTLYFLFSERVREVFVR